ncbi:uncharacterized protein A4U43_C07F13930, partial [Asparagus officinalis]
MGKLSIGFLGLTELFVSTLVHVLFGFYIFSTAVASDLSQSLTVGFKPMNHDVGLKEEVGKRKDSILEGSSPFPAQPPIVLVHGIFGFGKG